MAVGEAYIYIAQTTTGWRHVYEIALGWWSVNPAFTASALLHAVLIPVRPQSTLLDYQ